MRRGGRFVGIPVFWAIVGVLFGVELWRRSPERGRGAGAPPADRFGAEGFEDLGFLSLPVAEAQFWCLFFDLAPPHFPGFRADPFGFSEQLAVFLVRRSPSFSGTAALNADKAARRMASTRAATKAAAQTPQVIPRQV
jgi:hypothetical protein